MIKLQYKLRNFCCALLVAVMSAFVAFSQLGQQQMVYADDANASDTPHFVTIYDYDDNSTITVKTNAETVAEVLEKAEIKINDSDIVEPGLEMPIVDNEFRINVHRARPVVVMDGTNRRYVMSASYDPRQIVADAGLPLYDGDEIAQVVNNNFLETGIATTYKIRRNGGRQVTVEETIGYAVEEKLDPSLAKGERVVEQAGEDGRKVTTFEVQFQNNQEVSRTMISEEIKSDPVPEIVRIGAKKSIPPERQKCADWVRQAGVPEPDVEAAIDLIYHESGCRVDARNASSGAYGIPQALPGNKMASAGADWETNPITQIRWMSGYVKRYGGWQGARGFWYDHGWY